MTHCGHCRDDVEHGTETPAGLLCPRCLGLLAQLGTLPSVHKPRRGWPFVDEPSREAQP